MAVITRPNRTGALTHARALRVLRTLVAGSVVLVLFALAYTTTRAAERGFSGAANRVATTGTTNIFIVMLSSKVTHDCGDRANALLQGDPRIGE